LLCSAHTLTEDGRFAEATLLEASHSTSVVNFNYYESFSIRVPSCDVLVAEDRWVPVASPPPVRIRPDTIIAALEGRGKDGWRRDFRPGEGDGFARDWPTHRARVYRSTDNQENPCYRGILHEFQPEEGWLLITAWNYRSSKAAKQELAKKVKDRLRSGQTTCS
jgi:hypothetical protein